MEQSKQCSARIEQGLQKGQQCARPCLENGYCGKHQKQAQLDSFDKDLFKKCQKTRCSTLLDKTDINVYCIPCKEKHQESRSSLKLCKGVDGKSCKFEANNTGFCGKHQLRGCLLEEANAGKYRICDDARRSCKNKTLDGKLRCEDCLSKTRERDNTQYQARSINEQLCLGCGIEIKEYIKGVKGHLVQRCNSCYEQLRKVENERDRSSRNYNQESKNSLDDYYNEYYRNAIKRNLQYLIDRQNFKDTVMKPCYYCGEVKENEVRGIDRIDSSRGYTVENIVACCSMCNTMKNEFTINDFLEKIKQIHTHLKLSVEIAAPKNTIVSTNSVAESSTYIRPSKICLIYTQGKLAEYIELCIKENRSPTYISKLKAIEHKKLPNKEFVKYLRLLLQAEAKLNKYYKDNAKQRVSHKDLYNYIEFGNYEHAVEIYETVHGEIDGFKEDMKDLADSWKTFTQEDKTSKLHTLLVKYQNRRNYLKLTKDTRVE